MPRAYSRSRSRSPRQSSRRARSRSATYSRSPSPPPASKRLHVANIDDSISRKDVEESFGRFGKLIDVWCATYSPFYAFVTYEREDEASLALRVRLFALKLFANV